MTLKGSTTDFKQFLAALQQLRKGSRLDRGLKFYVVQGGRASGQLISDFSDCVHLWVQLDGTTELFILVQLLRESCFAKVFLKLIDGIAAQPSL